MSDEGSTPLDSKVSYDSERSTRRRNGFQQFFVGLILFFSLATAALYFVFVNSETQLEIFMKKAIGEFSRGLTNFDKSPSKNPLAVQQEFTLEIGVLAYTDKLVYSEGDILYLAYSAAEPMMATVTYSEFPKKAVVAKITLAESIFSRPLVVNSFYGFNPSDTAIESLDLTGYSAGWHQIELKSGKESTFLPFFVESKSLSHRVVFVESTDTLKAYVSDSGLATFYDNPKGLAGSFTRPNAYPVNYEIRDFLTPGPRPVECLDHLVNADLVLKQGLADLGVKFDVVSDDWLSESEIRNRADVVILGAHNEYWRASKFQEMQKFIDQGGSLLVLGGNNAWRFIEDSGRGYELIWGDGALDTRHRDFVENYLGSHYEPEDYGTYGFFQLEDERPSFLAESELSELFGQGTDFVDCEGSVLGASGHETDRLVSKESNFTVIARGSNPHGGADLLYKEFRGGGRVLNFGSIALWHRISDPTIQQIISSFLAN